MEAGVKVYLGSEKLAVANFMKLTTHQLIWYEPDHGKAWSLPLSRVLNVFTATEGTFRVKTFCVLEIANKQDITKPGPVVRLAFKGRSGEDDLTKAFKTVLGKRSWEDSEKNSVESKMNPSATAPSGKLSAAAGGIAIIHRNQVAKQRANQLMTVEAFADLDALMTHAKNMVELISRYTSTAESKSKKSSADSSSEKSDKAAYESILDHMGIANPVTRETSGTVYFKELSRQLADFVMAMLDRPDSGGIAQLTDVYCAFNRARGTELVTAEDLLKSCEMFSMLGLPVRLARFSSGVLVVQRLQDDGSRVNTQKIAELIKERESRKAGVACFVTAASVAASLRVSIVVARAELEAAERKMLVVRDEHVEGICWYLNRFSLYNKK